MESKPPAAVGERISKDGRHDSGDVAPSSTKISSLEGRSGGSAYMPKVIEVFGPSRTFCLVVQLFPRIACTAIAAPSVRSRVFVFVSSASMTQRRCRASCSRRAASCSKSTVISSWNSSNFYLISRNAPASVGWPDPNSSCWGMGPLLSETASLAFRSMLGKPQD